MANSESHGTASSRDLWLAAIISLIVSGTVSILTAWLMS